MRAGRTLIRLIQAVSASARGAIMGDVTVLLAAARKGESLAVGRIFELLYPELRRAAHRRLRQHDHRLLLETNALVHEAYLRLLGARQLNAADRGHFLAYAARVMRSVVVDLMREQMTMRRGGLLSGPVTLDTTALGQRQPQGEAEVIQIHEALDELEKIDRRLVQVVELRYFAGLSNQEVAHCLGLCERTVERDWQKARSFLYSLLRQD